MPKNQRDIRQYESLWGIEQRFTANGKRQLAVDCLCSLFLESINKLAKKIENNSHVHDEHRLNYSLLRRNGKRQRHKLDFCRSREKQT